jgi:pimeloyl-ACP methyl ester carboxylesterase
MATFLLVHGAWQGAWCWESLIPLVEQRGHRAVTLDLPGHGCDLTPPESVTLEDYVDAVIRKVHSTDSAPVLVGHSMGGVVSAIVAEQIPEEIKALVPVASSPALHGGTMMNAVAALDQAYLAHLVWSPDRRTARMAAQGIRDFLYQRCPQEFVDLAVERFSPEPVAPYQSRITLTPERYGRVPRFYIGCEHDRVVTKQVQQQACQTILPMHVYSIDADHSPFFSASESLANCLDSIARNL